MNAIHYIVAGAKSPQGRAFIQSLAEKGFDARKITAIDLKPSKMSYGEDAELTVADPSAYKQKLDRGTALFVLADTNSAFIDIADDHLDDEYKLLDLTGHFLGDPDAVLAPADGRLVIQASPAARMLSHIIKNLPATPVSLTASVLLPASHFGKDGMDELFNQFRQFLMAEEMDSGVFPKKLAFNLLPNAGGIEDNGLSSEELRLHAELRRLFPDIKDIVVTVIIAPVFIGTSVNTVLRFEEKLDARVAATALRRDRGIRVIDPNSEMVAASPAEIAGDDQVSVSRLHNQANALSFFAAADNTLY